MHPAICSLPQYIPDTDQRLVPGAVFQEVDGVPGNGAGGDPRQGIIGEQGQQGGFAALLTPDQQQMPFPAAPERTANTVGC